MAINKTKLDGGGETGEITQKNTIFSRFNSKFKSMSLTKQFILIFGSVLIMLFMITAINILRSKVIKNEIKQSMSKTSNICTQDESLIRRVGTAKLKNDIVDLKVTYESIKQKENYDQDQNCLYALLVYEMAAGDSDNARKTYETYKLIYKLENDKFIALGLVKEGEISNLDGLISIQEKQNKEVMDNVKTFSPPAQLPKAN